MKTPDAIERLRKALVAQDAAYREWSDIDELLEGGLAVAYEEAIATVLVEARGVVLAWDADEQEREP